MSGQYKKYISEKEEVRDGFLVTSNRKKVRNVQLGLLEEFKRICEKYNLKYYADGGTMLGAIRHGGFIPWDDDIDIAMFKEDYDSFLELAEKELPDFVKLCDYYGKFSKLVNINTAALGYDFWLIKDGIGGISIDIFPLKYASKYKLINRIKSKILNFLGVVMVLQKSNRHIIKKAKWKIIVVQMIKFFCDLFRIDSIKIHEFCEKINNIIIFKGKNIYTGYCSSRFFPDDIYDNSHDIKFENTTICMPDGYDTYLRILYGNYNKPVIYEGGHNCRYSVDKSYKDIIETFDTSKSNIENYKNCKSLFVL